MPNLGVSITAEAEAKWSEDKKKGEAEDFQ